MSMGSRRAFLGALAAFGASPFLVGRGEAQQAGQTPPALTNPMRAQLDALFEGARTQWQIPGLSAVMANAGGIIYAKGFGRTRAGDQTMVDANTLFGCASTAKAFTAALCAKAVGQGHFKWDTPVRDILPGFKLADGSDHGISIEDCLSHRIGMHRHDLIWYGRGGLSTHDLLAVFAGLQLDWPVRSRYEYNNLAVMLAGACAAQVFGGTFEHVLAREILMPLGLSHIALNAEIAQARGAAHGHKRPNGAWIAGAAPIPFRPQDAIGAAGALFASANDYGQWIRILLNNGVLGGQNLLPNLDWQAMYAPRTPTGASRGGANGYYGAGWRVDEWDGHRRIAHGGNLNGHSARITLLPDLDIGIAVFCNMRGTPLPGLVSLDALEAFLGRDANDWAASEYERRAASMNHAADTAPANAPASANDDMAGVGPFNPRLMAANYHHPAYGLVRVDSDNNMLRARYNGMDMTLEPQASHFICHPIDSNDDDLEGLRMAFDADFTGHYGQLRWQVDTDMAPVTFMRQA